MSGSTLMIIEIDKDVAEVTTFTGVGRILPRIGGHDLEPMLGSGITVERVLKTTSDEASSAVREIVRGVLAAERDLDEPRAGG